MDHITHVPLPNLTFQDGVSPEDVDAGQIVESWISKLNDVFKTKSFDNLSELLIEDCWWRDIVGLTWDFSTKHGQAAISKYLSNATSHLSNIQTDKSTGMEPALVNTGGMVWVQGGFTFRHPHGEGKGFVRLANVGKSDWRAWIVFTQLLQLDFQKDLEAKLNASHASAAQALAATEETQLDEDLQVLIVGAGQAGCGLGARLKAMGINTLLVDKSARVGDSWRERYRVFMLHTPKYTDHYPFLKTPDNWPRWIGRDKVADFLEHYSQIMDLNVQLKTTVTKAEYEADKRRYRVEIEGPDGAKKILTPRHVVLAAGLFSKKPVLPDIPGKDLFRGQLYHSLSHDSASDIADLPNKNVVIIGSGPSGHDLAFDFVTNNAKSVSLVQRSPTFSLSADTVEQTLLAGWNTPGVALEDADVIGNSLPTAVVRALSVPLSHMMCARDRDMIDRLKAAGLAVRTGENGVGLAEFQLIRGGKFYVDQGANQMIIDGRIKILRSEGGVREFTGRGVVLADGREVDADVVVLATGQQRALLIVREIMGDAVAEKVGGLQFMDVDEEQERKGFWRPTGLPGFWYMSGALMWCRQFSLSLALQIAAVEKGLNPAHYDQ